MISGFKLNDLDLYTHNLKVNSKVRHRREVDALHRENFKGDGEVGLARHEGRVTPAGGRRVVDGSCRPRRTAVPRRVHGVVDARVRRARVGVVKHATVRSEAPLTDGRREVRHGLEWGAGREVGGVCRAQDGASDLVR